MNDDLKEYFKNMFASVDKNIVLDDDQINAIVNDDKYTLVLAGAGTGKTTTMVGKVKYLVDIKHVDPSKILVISYTRKAVEELQDILIDTFGINTNVTTFHSLAYKYIREIFKDKKCAIVDYNKRNEVFYNYINEKFNENKMKDIVGLFNESTVNQRPPFYGNYFKENYQNYSSYDEFFNAYKKYRMEEAEKIGIYRAVNGWIKKQYNSADSIFTIKGELVKSVGEAVIANFLYRHGIDYRYEKVYDEIVDERRVYRPDFTLNFAGEEVYLEYFGLNDPKYNRIKNKKIELHKMHNNKFFYIEGTTIRNIERKLHDKLQEMGFVYRKRSSKTVFEQILNSNKLSQIYKLKNLFYECINKIKESVNRNEYQTIINNYLSTLNSYEQDICIRQFEYINEFYIYYSKNAYGSPAYYFDFSDLIYYANKYMHELPFLYSTDYEYILIDEYQDISDGEYDLTRISSNSDVANIFAVGDDWQSIYSFRGSNIGYITKFKDYFPNPTVLSIKKTYRNSQELVDIAGSFIKANKDQLDKNLVSFKHLARPIHFIEYNDYVDGKIDETIEYDVLKKLIIKIHEHYPTHSILILGRTNDSIENCFKFEKDFNDDIGTRIKIANIDDLNVEGMTIHKSKGLTYDEVIIIGMNKSFPKDEYRNFWLYGLFKPQVPKESIEFAEERRVFYVALTRTKNNVFILDNQNVKNRSRYVDELKKLCEENTLKK